MECEKCLELQQAREYADKREAVLGDELKIAKECCTYHQNKCLELQQENARLESQFQGLDKAAGEVYRKYIDLQQSLHAAQQEVERLKANHCKDCCCAQSWEALGVQSYTGQSIPEHISALQAENAKLSQEVERYKRLHDLETKRAMKAEGEGFMDRLELVRLQAENVKLRDRIEATLSAFGEHPDSEVDIAQRVSEIRDEGRGHFHTVTKLQEQLRQVREELKEAVKQVRDLRDVMFADAMVRSGYQSKANEWLDAYLARRSGREGS